MTVRDGIRFKDGRLVSRESGKQVNVWPRGKFFPRGVIHITLQEVFWIASITWIIVQVWNVFHNNKKK